MNNIIKLVKPYINTSLWRIVRSCVENLKFELLYFSYLINSPFLTSYLWILFSKDIVNVGSKNRVVSIIVFESPGGRADIISAFSQKDEGYRFIFIDGEYIKHLFKYIVCENCNDIKYSFMLEDRANKLDIYHKYLSKMTCNFKNQVKLKAYINFNYIYHAQRELMIVANELGIKFITVMKECLRTEGYIESTIQVYKEKIGLVYPSAIFVHNKQTKDLINRSGIYPLGKVEIVGQARSDVCHRFYDSKAKYTQNSVESHRPKRILYFAISETAGLPYFGEQSYFINNKDYLLPKNFKWSDVASSVLKCLEEYCEQNTSIELIVKGKPSGVYDEYDAKSKRITYIHGNPALEILVEVDVVVGMNTTGLFEAVAAGLPTISAELGVKRDLVINRYLYHLNDVVTVAADKAELFDALDLYLNSEYKTHVNSNREVLLDTYLGNADGFAGARLRKAICKHLI